MPRKAKRMQPAVAPQEQGYGIRGEQIAAQNQMGIPDNRGAAPFADAASPVAPGAPVQPSGPTSPDDLLNMLAQQPPPPPGGLARPTERPTEDVTTGLQQEVKPARNVAAETLEAIAAATRDPRFLRMAQRARSI